MYNVEVDGHLVWLEWTTDKAAAYREAQAWRLLGQLTRRCLQVRVVFARG